MLEAIFNFIVDLTKSFITFLKILLRSKLFLPKHKAVSDTCIILGNGPSLKKVLAENTELLKKHTLLCVNKFPDTEAFEELRPRYFIFTATGYFRPEKIKHEQETRKKIIDALVKKTNWPLILLCPSQAKSNSTFINKIRKNSNIEISFFNTTPVEGYRFFNHIFMSRGWGMPRPHNVLIPSIYTCIIAGFRNIYLLGADHSWLPLISVNEKNDALINQVHFYDDGESKSGHMFRNSKARRLHEILEKFMLSFRAYFELEAFAKSKGCKIYNSTPGSYIDAFERRNIDDV